MVKSKLISITLPILVLLLGSVFFQMLSRNRVAPEEAQRNVESITNETDNSTTATTIENARPLIEFPQKVNNKTLSIKSIAPQEWSKIESERNLSITPKRNFIVSSKAVQINFAALNAVRNRAFNQLILDLGTGDSVVAEIGSRHEHGTDAYSFAGRLEGEPESEFSISVYKDAVVGTFKSQKLGIRQLRFVAPGIHRVDEIDPALAPNCAPPLMDTHVASASSQASGKPLASVDLSQSEFPLDGIRPGDRESYEQQSEEEFSKESAAEQDSEDSFDGETALDVLVAYTPATVLNEGSLNATLALINQGVVDTNTAFQNSNIDAILRLVGTAEVSYTGTGASAALNAFLNTSDGAMDEIHNLRNTYGADFVSLWIPLSDACGVASLITTLSTSQAYRAFSVCDPDCQFKYTFTHELGHNWGSTHAVGDAGETRGRAMYNYSHGWRWYGSNGIQYRSLLAYSPGSRIKHFSDPNTLYQGVASGRPNLEDNARSIGQVKDVMSQFRSTSLDDHGNTIATATTVSTNSTTNGVLENTSDKDVFRITLSSSDTFIATTIGSTNTRGRLLNAAGTAIATDSSSGTGTNFAFSQQLAAGTYYVEVLSESNSTGSYLLSVGNGSGDDHGNSILTATSVPITGNTSGSLEQGGDEDFFRLTIPEPGTLTVSTTGVTDTYGYLLNSSGSTLESDDDSGSSINFRMQRAVSSGVYFVRLTGYSASTTGPYQLSVSFLASPDDHANGFTEATGVTTGTTANPSVIAGNFESVGDVDFLRFTLFGSNDLDPDLTAFDDLTLDIEPSGSYPYSQNGFTLAPYPGGRFSKINSNTNPAFPPGSYIRLLTGDSLEITNDEGDLFDVISIDLSEYSTAYQSPQTLSWIGFKPDGTTVTHTVTTDGIMDGTGPAIDFETFQFPASFTGLTKLQAGAGKVFNADNFVLRLSATAIPTGLLNIYSSGTTDTVATLYNSSFVSVATDDNSGSGSNFTISRDDFPTGTYYLRVSEFGNNNTGLYNIHLGYDQIITIPAAPSGFTASQNSDEAVLLQWDSVQNSTSYSIYRGSTAVFNNATRIAANLSTANHNDATSVPGQTYFYWVTASNSLGESPPSSGATGLRAFERPEIFSQPASSSIPGGTSTSLSVAAASSIGTLSYQWYQGTSGDISTPVGPNTATYTTPLLVQDSMFWVRVSNGFNHRDSQTATITLLLAPPTLVTASRGTSDSKIRIRWIPVNQSNSYSIYRALSDDFSAATKIATTTEPSFVDTTALAGNIYFYYIRVINASGNESAPSGSSSHSGFVSNTAIDADFIPTTGISDISYSNDSENLYVAGDSGWIDGYATATRNLTQWAGINSPVSGIDVSQDRVIAASSSSSQGNGLLFDIDFSPVAPTFSSASISLDSGDTGLYDAVFGRDGFALVTSRSNNSTTALTEVNLTTRTSEDRSDIPGAGGLLAPASFLVRSSTANVSPDPPASESYRNEFDSRMSSLSELKIREIETGEVVVENSKLRLDPATGYLNRLSIEDPASSNERADTQERIELIEGSNPGTRWFSYSPSNNSFGAGRNHTAKIESAAISPRSGSTALSSASETTVIDQSGNQTAVINRAGTVAFSPTHDHLYLTDDSTNEICVYSTLTWSQMATIPVSGGFTDAAGPLGSGNLAIRPDGEEVALVTAEGIRLFDATPFQSDGLPAVSPLEHTFTGSIEGGNEGKTRVFILNNSNAFTSNWTASVDVNWLSLTETSGAIAAGESSSTLLATTVSANALPLGEHSGNIIFSNPDTGVTISRPITMRIESSASLPIYEDFENALSGFWSTSSTASGRTRRISDHGPIAGDAHFLMDTAGGNALNKLTLTANLTGATGVELRFRAQEFADQHHPSPSTSYTGFRNYDGVEISEDGIRWHPVLSFPASFGSYTEFFIDLDSAISSRGLSYNSSFKIRFSQYGENPIPSDGIALDDIEVTTAADRSEPGQISISTQGSELVNGMPLELGNVSKDEDIVLTIANTGPGVLRNLDYSTSEFGEFVPIFGSIDRLLPGAEMLTVIRPDSFGENVGTIRYTSNDPNDNPFVFVISAFGVQSLSSWRLEQFGTAANSGIAANENDPNSDGVTNLEAFAYGLDPKQFSNTPFKITLVTADEVIAQYQRSLSASAEGISFVVEWKNDLSDPTWSSIGVVETVLSSSNGVETVQVTISSDGELRKFLQLSVTQ